MLILTPKKEGKIGQNNPENRRRLSFAGYPSIEHSLSRNIFFPLKIQNSGDLDLA
jgi:hypothetical protein